MDRLRSLFGLTARHRTQVDTPAPWPVVYLPRTVAEETARLIASFGTADDPHEGITYWAGVETDTALVVTTAITPEAVTTAGSYQTSIIANAQVVQEVNAARLRVLAQIHGHPGRWVGHSGGDDAAAFMPYRGFYSIIVPHYGRRGMLPLNRCGVYRYEGAQFAPLRAEDIEVGFILVETSVDLRRLR